ncbi:MAG: heavy-metal-associated domain-containing protein [Spirochaetaceae bacterium]|jgi:copper ion binding protein|nr:heavy-metal-associated domain-containing protein [Spirochaetaceae bacterium]
MKLVKTVLSVGGMTCEHCVKHVTEALKAVSGVKKAKANLKSGKADVEHDDSVALETLENAVKEAGFTVTA